MNLTQTVQEMNDKKSDGAIYIVGLFIGFFIGMWIVYVTQVQHNLLLPEKDYECVGAAPIAKDPSIVACTIFLRKDSDPYKQYQALNNDSTN